MHRSTKKPSTARGTCPFCSNRAPLLADGKIGSHTKRSGTRNVFCGGLGQKPKA